MDHSYFTVTKTDGTILYWFTRDVSLNQMKYTAKASTHNLFLNVFIYIMFHKRLPNNILNHNITFFFLL